MGFFDKLVRRRIKNRTDLDETGIKSDSSSEYRFVDHKATNEQGLSVGKDKVITTGHGDKTVVNNPPTQPDYDHPYNTGSSSKVSGSNTLEKIDPESKLESMDFSDIVSDSHTVVYELGDRIAGGGEGEIFLIKNDPTHVIKRFFSNKTSDKEKKIKEMMDNPVGSDVRKNITWPNDIYYENGIFAGYRMDLLQGNTERLNEYYEFDPRQSKPIINKIIVARNLCAVLEGVHKSKQIIGDFNPNNVMVDIDSGKITLMDADSYHISGGKYRCSVGMQYYLPKEIVRKINTGNGVTLENAPLPTFTEDSDNFALAIHIFQLLMNGCHPFCGAINSEHGSIPNPPPNVNIESGMVPFINPSPNIVTPAYAPDYNSIKPLHTLFYRAFIDGDRNPSRRPKPEEWIPGLDLLLNSLTTCASKKHKYYRGLDACPYCEVLGRFKGKTFVKTRLPQLPVDPSLYIEFEDMDNLIPTSKDYLLAEQGDPGAYNKIGTFFYIIGGKEPKYRESAVIFFKYAAEHGNGHAQYRLASYYRHGNAGLPQSLSEAARWYSKAMDAKDIGAVGTDISRAQIREGYEACMRGIREGRK